MAQKFYCIISLYLTFLFYYCNYVIYLFSKKCSIRSWWTGPPRLALAIRGPVNMLKCLFIWNKELLLLIHSLPAPFLGTWKWNTFVTAFRAMCPVDWPTCHSSMFGSMAKKTRPGQQNHTCPLVNHWMESRLIPKSCRISQQTTWAQKKFMSLVENSWTFTILW